MLLWNLNNSHYSQWYLEFSWKLETYKNTKLKETIKTFIRENIVTLSIYIKTFERSHVNISWCKICLEKQDKTTSKSSRQEDII